MNGFHLAAEGLTHVLQALRMPPIFGVAVSFLAFIFAWSGLAKWRAPLLAAAAIVDFGVLSRIRPWAGRALAAGELLLFLGLISRLHAPLFLLTAAATLGIFAFLIARSLWRGQSFACYCFGESDSTLSGWSLARTAGLALLALILGTVWAPVHWKPQSVEVWLLETVGGAAVVGTVALLGRMSQLLAEPTASSQRGRGPVSAGR